MGGGNKKMKLIKLQKNKKAISPIFATLILIAIAVIAGIVVYMFTSGTLGTMASGGTAAQEKVAVQGVGNFGTGTFDVYASYVSGGNDININGAIIKATDGTTTLGTCSDTLTTDGAVVPIQVTGSLTSGQTYSVTLTSSKGGSFSSSSFTAP